MDFVLNKLISFLFFCIFDCILRELILLLYPHIYVFENKRMGEEKLDLSVIC